MRCYKSKEKKNANHIYKTHIIYKLLEMTLFFKFLTIHLTSFWHFFKYSKTFRNVKNSFFRIQFITNINFPIAFINKNSFNLIQIEINSNTNPIYFFFIVYCKFATGNNFHYCYKLI